MKIGFQECQSKDLKQTIVKYSWQENGTQEEISLNISGTDQEHDMCFVVLPLFVFPQAFPAIECMRCVQIPK